MKILLMGPPSSGKGTIGALLSAKLGLPLIGTGELLRSLPSDHPNYNEIHAVMNSGGLVPTELVSDIVRERLQKQDCHNGYILDGYPRDFENIKLFEPEIDKVLLLKVSMDTIIKRVTGRRLCTADGKIYNIYTLPPEKLVECKGQLIQRADDTEEALEKRLEIYHTTTLEVANYFRKKGIVLEINGEPAPEEILTTALKELGVGE